MDSAEFKRLSRRVAALTSSYGVGYRYGLRRHFHGTESETDSTRAPPRAYLGCRRGRAGVPQRRRPGLAPPVAGVIEPGCARLDHRRTSLSQSHLPSPREGLRTPASRRRA